MNAQKGYVLILVLVAVLLISGLSALAIRQSMTDVRYAFAKTSVEELFVMADMPLMLLRQPSIKERLMSDGGIIDTLVAHHLNKGDFNQQTSAQLCYEPKRGVDNFASSGLMMTGQISCTDGQVWLWLSVQSMDDETVSKDERQVANSKKIVSNNEQGFVKVPPDAYRFTIHSLATKQATSCLGVYEMVKACLNKQGVAHQVLVQEFIYRRAKNPMQDNDNLAYLAVDAPSTAMNNINQDTPISHQSPSTQTLTFIKWYDVRSIGQSGDE